MLKNSRGFTLIELMVTVAIVGILTAIALPAYQSYTIRSQVSEGLSLVSGAKPLVGEYFANHGKYPTNSEAGFKGYVGKYITKTELGSNGKIVATFGNDVNSKISGKTVTLTPQSDTGTGNLKWNCDSTVAKEYLPNSCDVAGSAPGGLPDGSGYMNNIFKIENGKVYFYGNGSEEELGANGVDENGNNVYDLGSLATWGAEKLYVAPDGTVTMIAGRSATSYYNDGGALVNTVYTLPDSNGQMNDVALIVASPGSSATGASSALQAALNKAAQSGQAILSNTDQYGQSVYKQELVDTYNQDYNDLKNAINDSINRGETVPQIYLDVFKSQPIPKK